MRGLFVVLATLFGLGFGLVVSFLIASQVHMGDYGPGPGGLVALGLALLAIPLGGIVGAVVGVRNSRQQG